MLGSHFDLAKVVETIAARREHAPPAAVTTAAYADFDKRIRDFVELIAPLERPGNARPITGSFLDPDD